MTLRIGHRGACGYEPENTLLSFRKALELGCDGVECDVHLCKSGEAVVIHDDTLQRTTSGRGKIAAHTLAELRALDAGKGERIPTLDEAISAMRGKMLFIEIKDQAAVNAVAAAITERYENLPVISFDWDILLHIKKRNPNILIGATPPERKIPAGYAARAKEAGMWSVNPCIDILDESFMRDARAHGLQVITWTANTPAQIARAKALGVDGIISDFPDRI